MRPTFADLLLTTLISLWLLTGCAPAPELPAVDSGLVARIAAVESGLEPRAPVADEAGWNLEERMAHYKVPGLSLVVFDDGQVVWAAAYGVADRDNAIPVTPKTLFQAGSISKPVAAAVALELVEQGKLDLDAPINDVLMSWKLPENEFTAEAPVTPRRLLSHTAGTTVHGFPGYATGEEVPSLTQVLDGTAPANTAPIRVDVVPGSIARYSGGGTTVMQQAMIDLGGKAFPALAAELVLAPLGMSRSTYEQPLPPDKLAEAAVGHRSNGRQVLGKRHVYPEMAAAGLWTTPSDLARFAISLQRAVKGHEGTLLEQDTANDMLTPVLNTAGLGLFVVQRGHATYFTHGGADEGFQALLVAHRDDDYGAALMANSDNGIRLIEEIVPAIARVWEWEGYAAEPLVPEPVSAESLDALVGRYRVRDDVILEVTRDGDRCLARVQLQDDPTRLVPQPAGVFVAQDDGTHLRFVLGEDGRAIGYVHVDDEEEKVRERIPDDEKPPVEWLDRGRVEEAVTAYEALEPDEERLNNLGYQLLFASRHEASTAIFELNTRLYPSSANAYDSLADAYVEQEDAERAAAAFRKVLELASSDPQLSPENVGRYEQKARAYLARSAP